MNNKHVVCFVPPTQFLGILIIVCQLTLCQIISWSVALHKGHPPSTDLRYGDEETISPSTLIFAARKGYLRIHTLYILPDVPKNLALR